MMTVTELDFSDSRRAKPPRHLADLTPAERREAAVELNEPPYRAHQLATHYFSRYTDDPSQMTDLPVRTRERMAQSLLPRLLTEVRDLTCDGGTTHKTLWRLHDGTLVESVLMRYFRDASPASQAFASGAGDLPESENGAATPARSRVTMCVSSQAGCQMACPFCATGQAGLTRNLSTAEIVGQVVGGFGALAGGKVVGGPGRVNNVVFMGMGEPLANYPRVLAAIRRLTEARPDGLGMSQRGITVSTVGLVPRMRQLTREGLSLTLAVSLHAPDDELRDELVPVNTRWKVAEVLDAAWEYAAVTRRRISIEYALMRDINDQVWRADLLGELLRDRLAHVNLIPLNPTPGSQWTASRPEDEAAFVARLRSYGITVTIRDTRGQEIDGACGQLAANG